MVVDSLRLGRISSQSSHLGSLDTYTEYSRIIDLNSDLGLVGLCSNTLQSSGFRVDKTFPTFNLDPK